MNQLNIQLKVCSKCKESLSVEKFNKDSGGKDGLHSQCKICKTEYDKARYQKNKGDLIEYQKKYYQGNKDQVAGYKKEYYQDNKAEISKQRKEYYQDNKVKINKRNNEYTKKKRKTNPNFKATKSLRYATLRLFKGAGKSKSERTIKILGVSSYEDALNRLLKTMPEGYTLQDFLDGKLVIDHKIPLSWFNLTIESELMEAGNINNLQLLTPQDNTAKGDKYGHMPDGSIILYEDWVMTRGIKING